MQTVKVHEIYFSISGEGISVGIPTVFVRFAGCSLRCGKVNQKKLWCDTPYALSPDAGKEMSINDVITSIQKLAKPPFQILLTGGEPLENEKKKFCQELVKIVYQKRHNYYDDIVRVETNGKESLIGLEQMCFTMDYKLPGSGMETYMNLDNFRVLKERNNSLDEIKFVIRDKNDFICAVDTIHKHKLDKNLLFSPVESECDPIELVEWIKDASIPGGRLSLQMHKILWGNKRGV